VLGYSNHTEDPYDYVYQNLPATHHLLRKVPDYLLWSHEISRKGTWTVLQKGKDNIAIGNHLMSKGYKLVTDGTENHLVLWDLRPLGLTGMHSRILCHVLAFPQQAVQTCYKIDLSKLQAIKLRCYIKITGNKV
jgi:hypothetical protein